ncbi:MAG TPA: malto-oligosyltrehalose trehalohydrolase [Chitinophagaceae bacterium]
MDISKRSIGVNFREGKAIVKVWAPAAKEVALKPVVGGTPLPLRQEDYGYWTVTTDALRPGDTYKILLDGEKELPDPASLSQPGGVHGPSQALDLATFPWSDGAWKNTPLEDYLIYELHTSTFTQEGTFKGIEEQLDYLAGLGVTAIEIMPVAQFPGNRNWGYDGVYPYAVQDSYGGAAGLQHLVDACHRKGLAVVLDVVYNHLGPEGNYLGAYGPFFTDKYHTPWGNALNFDDAGCDGVREFYIENALMWFRDFHIDALRLDAVHAIKDFSPVHLLQEIRRRTDQLMKETGRIHYLIVELDLNDPRFINPEAKGGYGMDAQWIDEFHHALRVAAGGDRTGYYSDFNGLGHLAKSYRDAYVYDGQYSPHRKKKFGLPAAGNEGRQFIVFSQNHDQVGNRMLGERSSRLYSFEMQKLMAGAVLLSPFLPMLFMGEEWSEPHPFLYFVSHTDPELAEAVRKGRKEEFAAFHADGEAPDPVAVETFQGSKLQWALLEHEPHKTMLHYYKTLIWLRKSHPALHNLDRQGVKVQEDSTRGVLLLQRTHATSQVQCWMNFSGESQRVTLPGSAAEWHVLLDSAHPDWKGPKGAAHSAAGGSELILQPESLLVFSNTRMIS